MYESMIFYRSFYEAIQALDKPTQVEVYDAIIRYGLNGEEPEELTPLAKVAFTLAKPQIDATNLKKENGKKGGRPKKTLGYENKNLRLSNEKPKVIENKNLRLSEKKPKVFNRRKASKQAGLSEKDTANLTIYNNIISYLNNKTNSNYKSESKYIIELINELLREGYTEEDFKKVIDIKCSEWQGTDMQKFLRPNTLFAVNHFAEYLNQKPEVKKQFTKMQNTNYDFEALRKMIDE